jgi:hypothetical protein
MLSFSRVEGCYKRPREESYTVTEITKQKNDSHDIVISQLLPCAVMSLSEFFH